MLKHVQSSPYRSSSSSSLKKRVPLGPNCQNPTTIPAEVTIVETSYCPNQNVSTNTDVQATTSQHLSQRSFSQRDDLQKLHYSAPVSKMTCSCLSISHHPFRSRHLATCTSSDISTCSSSPSSNSSSVSSGIENSHSSSSKGSFTRGPCHQKGLEITNSLKRTPDNVSLNSSISCSTSSKDDDRLNCSLSSSAASIENSKTTVRIWVRCLLQEMEYKTVCISYSTTCREVVNNLLSKFRMRHRDPNLFYLAMEVSLKKAGAEVRTCLRLEDDSFPAQLLACHPQRDSRLTLRMRRGGLLRIYDGSLSQGSQYKSLLVGEKTCCIEVVSLVLACNKVNDSSENFSLFEVFLDSKQERLLEHKEQPMIVANQWTNKERRRLEIRCLNDEEKQKCFLTPPIENNLNLHQKIIPKINDNDNCQKIFSDKSINQSLVANHSDVQMECPLLCSMESDQTSRSDCSSRSSEICNLSSSASSPEEDSSELLFLEAKRTTTVTRILEGSKGSTIVSNFLLTAKSDNRANICNRPTRRKLPLPPDLLWIESTVDDDIQDSSSNHCSIIDTPSSTKTFKTYNDYENYFYI